MRDRLLYLFCSSASPLAVICCFLCPRAIAAPADFALDPARSTFRLGGMFNGAPLVAQSPGSDVTGFSGVLSVDVDRAAGTLSISPAGPRAEEQPADQRPFSQFGEVAVYGLRTAGAGDNLLAVRGLDLYVDAENAPFNAGPATDGGVGFFVSGGVLYYATPAAPFRFADLHGYGGGAAAAVESVSLVREGDVETLTIPIRTQFTPWTGEGGDAVEFTFAGQLVATRLVPEPTVAAAALVGLALVMMGRRAAAR